MPISISKWDVRAYLCLPKSQFPEESSLSGRTCTICIDYSYHLPVKYLLQFKPMNYILQHIKYMRKLYGKVHYIPAYRGIILISHTELKYLIPPSTTTQCYTTQHHTQKHTHTHIHIHTCPVLFYSFRFWSRHPKVGDKAEI